MKCAFAIPARNMVLLLHHGTCFNLRSTTELLIYKAQVCSAIGDVMFCYLFEDLGILIFLISLFFIVSTLFSSFFMDMVYDWGCGPCFVLYLLLIGSWFIVRTQGRGSFVVAVVGVCVDVFLLIEIFWSIKFELFRHLNKLLYPKHSFVQNAICIRS